MNQILILQIIAVFVWIEVGIIVAITILYPPVDEIEEDFLRTITGLECHQMERYILDMEYQLDKVTQYHSFKCVDILEEFLDDEDTTDDVDIIVRGYDVNGQDVDGDVDGNDGVNGNDGDVNGNDGVTDGGGRANP